MEIFIGWSGDRSRRVAEALSGWLQQVIQAVDPWISPDIAKGKRWEEALWGRLESSRVGIFCLTKDNLNSKYIHFEAGAISKTKGALACTFLLDVSTTDIEYPLQQFQHTKYEKADIWRLLSDINNAVKENKGKNLSEATLTSVYEKNWTDLDERLKAIAALKPTIEVPKRATLEVLEDVLKGMQRIEAGQQTVLQVLRVLRTSTEANASIGAPSELEKLLAGASGLGFESISDPGAAPSARSTGPAASTRNIRQMLDDKIKRTVDAELEKRRKP